MINWAYVAGFFDGEGSIVFTGSTCKISIAQNTRKVLENIQAFLMSEGITHSWVTESPPRPFNRQPNTLYHLAFSHADNVRLFFDSVLPFSVVKKDKILDAYDRLTDTPRKSVTTEEYQNAKSFLAQGCTYRQVQDATGIMFNFRTLKKLKEEMFQEQRRRAHGDFS